MFFQAALDVWPLPRIPATKCDKPNQLLQLLATALSAATFQRPWLRLPFGALRLPFGALRPARKLNALEQEKKKVTLVQFPLRHGTVNGSKVWPIYIYIYNIIYGQKEWIFINHHFCWCFYWRYPILVPIFSCISKFPGGWLKWPPLDCIFCCSNRLKPPSFNIKPSSKLNHHVRLPPKMVAIWI